MTEAVIAEAIASYLGARRDVVASDVGSIAVDVVDGVLVAVVRGVTYRVEIIVTKL